MSDILSVLTATGSLMMAKTWMPDGKVTDYDLAKNFTLRRAPVDGIESLHVLLTELASQRQTCMIRGGYIGDELALPIMRGVKGWAKGHVLRQEQIFLDRALHTLMIDVDKFQPSVGHPTKDPVPALDEFIAKHLPECFSGISYRWQLSNSAGLAKNEGVLKAHLWFWMETPYTGEQLIAWAKTGKLTQLDLAVFRPIQCLYTADPVMSPGVIDPVAVRGGLVEGLFGSSVPLVLDPAALEAANAPASVSEVRDEIKNAVENDPVAQALYAKGMVRRENPRGGLFVDCPRADQHTDGKTGPSSCLYFPANTGGFKQGNFKCLHGGCEGAPQHLFTEALGFNINGDLAGFDEGEIDLFADSGVEILVENEGGVVEALSPSGKKQVVDVPEARHLCTDQANVQRLLKHFGKRLLVASDRWYAWDGVRWVPDDAIATRYAMRLSKIIAHEAEEWEKKRAPTGEEKELNMAVAKALKGWSTKAEMRSSIDAALALAKRVLVVEASELDRDEWLLTCLNGTVDLRTGRLYKHDPHNYITKVCPVNYDPTASATVFTNVLLRVCCEEGGPTPVAKFLQRWFGYCATASTREQKFVVHYGLGANGKSTILDIISEVLGDYAGTAAPGLLVAGGKDRHPTEIADLFGRRVVTAHESSDGGVLREDFIKQATGGDRIKARYMRADFFEFAPTHKLQLLTNHKPVIKSQDHGIWRRVVLVPYRARFGSPEEVALGSAAYVKDPKVLEHLRREKEGVLRWLIEGAVEWYRDGLNPPDYVMAASGEYQLEQDRVAHFVNENCDLDPDYNVFLTNDTNDGLFQVYEGWCKEGGFFALSKPRFLQEIERVVPCFRSQETQVTLFDGRRKRVRKLYGVRLMRDEDVANIRSF